MIEEPGWLTDIRQHCAEFSSDDYDQDRDSELTCNDAAKLLDHIDKLTAAIK